MTNLTSRLVYMPLLVSLLLRTSSAVQFVNRDQFVIDTRDGITAGKGSLSVTWTNASGPVTIVLVTRDEGNVTIGLEDIGQKLASDTKNQGSFQWDIPLSTPSSKYNLDIFDSGAQTDATPYFMINIAQSSSPTSSQSLTTKIANTPSTSRSTSSNLATPSTSAKGSLEAVVPRPKENWQGRKLPNYSIMYWEYTVPLHCVSGHNGLPVGVFGFYYWLGIIWTLLTNTGVALRVVSLHGAKDDRYASRFMNGLGVCVQFIVHLVLTSRRVTGCRGSLVGLTASDGTTIETALAPTTFIQKILFTQIVSGASAVILAQQLIWPRLKAVWIIPLIVVAVGSNFFITAFFYNGYANFLYTDHTMWRQDLAACLPMGVLVCVLVLGCWLVCYQNFCPGLLCLLLVLIIGFHITCTGIGFVQLGRTVNDPWGSQITGDRLGQLMVVLTSTLPVFNTVSFAVNVSGS